MKSFLSIFLVTFLFFPTSFSQNIGFNADGSAPHIRAMLDIASTKSGLLIPRMSTAQRDSIVTPPNGLQVYNISTSTLDIYRNSGWESLTFTNAASTIVDVHTLSDLPSPSSGQIILDASKTYIFSGNVDVSPNYININGAGIRGNDPGRDGIKSTVSGAILRSSNHTVFIQNLNVLPASANTKAYDFSDATKTLFCTLSSGATVTDFGIPSLGVGQISGFKNITFVNALWNCKDGVKITGNVGRFSSSLNYVTGISAGVAIEFLAGLTVDDIDISNNYFLYAGQTGVKVNAGATIGDGRMTANVFRGVGTYLSGFDSYTPQWELLQNTFIPNSRSFCFTSMQDNVIVTSLPLVNTFYKIAGTTVTSKEQRFTSTNNKLTYIGKRLLNAKVSIVVVGLAVVSGDDYDIAIAKNGVIIPAPFASTGTTLHNQTFEMTLITEVDLNTSDYIEVFISRVNTNTTSATVQEMQLRVND